jgi:anti-sigma B factor antagonist
VDQLSLTTASHGGIVVVAVSGELDIITSKQFDEHLAQARTSSDVLILDFSGLDFIDTTCLSVLVRYWKEQTEGGGSLLLAGTRYDYAKALWITGLAQRLPMYDNVAEALAAARS